MTMSPPPQITAIENCVTAGAKGILITPSNDSVGPALKAALGPGLALIKPSKGEFETLVGRKLADAELAEAAQGSGSTGGPLA